MRSLTHRWRTDFLTGLAVVLPAVITLAIVRWLFGTISNITDVLLFFIPRRITHQLNGQGQMYWYWSLVALALGIFLVSLVGRGTRFYIGKKLIRFVDDVLSRVPLLNKIYGTVKQVNAAFYSTKKTAFKQVVLFEYPRRGIYSVGFVTSEQHPEASAKIGRKMVGVFVPTTPNPTSGFLLVVPEDDVIPMEMSVADGIKYVISLGSVTPEYRPGLEPSVNGRGELHLTPPP